MIEVARRLNPRATFYVAAADQRPLPAGTVDVVMSSVSLHHWPDPAAGLREAARVLRADGRLLLADIAVPTWLAWLPRAGVRTRAELQRLVVGAGFSVAGRQSLIAGVVEAVAADKARATV